MPSIRSLALLLGLPLLAHATKPEHAVWQNHDDFAAGKCRSTSLTEDGVLSAAPVTAKLADLDVEEAWSILSGPEGSVLVGTAPEGKLLQVGADGTVKVLAKFNESHLYALAANPHGGFFVGSSPDGKVYQVDAAGKSQVWFDPHEKYIWALAVGPEGALYVGTGTKGRIYRVTARGKGEVWYASDETHIRALAFDRSGALLAGSAASGYLYRITGKDQGAVVAGTGHEEVNQISAQPDGTIWFTATGSAKESSTPVKKAADATGGGSSGGTSALYRITLQKEIFNIAAANPPSEPEQIWSSKEMVLSLSSDNQQPLLGTSAEGYIYCVSPHGEATRLCRIDSDSVTALAASGEDVVAATSNPGRLFRISRAKTSPGIYETQVLDSGSFAHWGAVKLGSAGTVKIFTRSGNTAPPDKTWYPWEQAPNGQTQSPASRYFQVQLQIGDGMVDRIDACFLTRNQPPHIDTIKILPVGVGYTQAPASPLPPLPQNASQLLSSFDSPEPKEAMRYQRQDGHGLRTLIWKASDPNGDDLTYSVFWRKKGENTWHDLAKNTTENLLTWDTSSWAEGRYELKVVASDAAANAPGEGLTDTAMSREMIVNNTPPIIQIMGPKNGAIEFTVSDELSGLASVTVSTDGKTYQSLPPVDGILDSNIEQFRAPVAPGQTLFIRAEDEAGNVAGAQTAK